jgi:hypothetical protein
MNVSLKFRIYTCYLHRDVILIKDNVTKSNRPVKKDRIALILFL